MKISWCIAVIFCTVWLSGCTTIGTHLANLPAHFDDTKVTRDVVYDAEYLQKMDIYRPRGKQQRDVIVFFYGGRWSSGSKDDYAFAGSAFAKKGYVVAIPDYRKYPDVRFPAFAQDAAKAVAWVSDNIGSYGGDATRIFVVGHSSGAHNGALIAADTRYLKALGKTQDTLKGFAGLAGPYAFIPTEPDLEDMFGPPEKYPEMQVPTFIDGNEPPMLLLWGEDDTAVGRFNLEKLEDAIRKNKGCVRTKIYEDTDHVWIVAALSWLGRQQAPALDDITDFFKTPPGTACS